MGTLFYGTSSEPTLMNDSVLAHLKVVASTKLRRNEAFTLSWRHTSDETPGRTTLWLQPSIPLRFVFESDDPEALNPRVLKDMVTQANSSGGLTIDLTADVAPADVAPSHFAPSHVAPATPVRVA